MKKKLFLVGMIGAFLVSCSSVGNSSLMNNQSLVGLFTHQLISGVGMLDGTSLASKAGPESTVEDFVTSLANGDCQHARNLATGRALETIQASIDAGCEPYTTEIYGIKCDVGQDEAHCTCEESRESMNMTFKYDLVFVKKKWKVEFYEKDFKLD